MTLEMSCCSMSPLWKASRKSCLVQTEEKKCRAATATSWNLSEEPEAPMAARSVQMAEEKAWKYWTKRSVWWLTQLGVTWDRRRYMVQKPMMEAFSSSRTVAVGFSTGVGGTERCYGRSGSRTAGDC